MKRKPNHRRPVRTLLRIAGIALCALSMTVSSTASPIGAPFPIKQFAGAPNDPTDVVFNPNHDEFLVLYDNWWGTDTQDIYAQRVAYDGTLLSWFTVIAGAGERHEQAKAAFSTVQDEYLIVWTTRDPTATTPPNDGIFGRQVSWNGAWMGPVLTIADEVDTQHYPSAAHNQVDDEYLVVYENRWASGVVDIAAQRVEAASGSLLSGATVATGPSLYRLAPNVAHDVFSNRYLIVYVSGQNGVYAKLAERDLAGVGAAIEISVLDAPPVYVSLRPGVVFGADEYLVVWYQANPPGDISARARRVSAAGVPQGPASGLVIGTGGGTWTGYDRVDVAFGPAGEYLAVWGAEMIGSGRDVSARLVTPGIDEPHGPRYEIAGSADNDEFPAVDCAPSGDCLVAYGHTNTSGHLDVFGCFVKVHLFDDGFETGNTSMWSLTAW